MTRMFIEPFLRTGEVGKVFLYSDVYQRFGLFADLVTDYLLRTKTFEPHRSGFKLLNNVPPIANLTDNPKYQAGVNIPILPASQLVAFEGVVQFGIVAQFMFDRLPAFDVHEFALLSSLESPGRPRMLKNKVNLWHIKQLAEEAMLPDEGEFIYDPIVSLVVKVRVPNGPDKVKLHYRLPKLSQAKWCLVEAVKSR
jgi:hypothetical protein